MLRPTLVTILLLASSFALQAQGGLPQGKLISVIPLASGSTAQFTFSAGDIELATPGELERLSNPANYSVARSNSVLLAPLNIGIATQLASMPLSSPASSMVFREDPATGAAIPYRQSLGPILSERAETIGKGRFFAGYTRQQFRFDRLEGQPLGNLSTIDVGGASSRVLIGGQRQVTSPVTIGTQVDIRLDQNIAFFTYGLTNRIDVSGALTWMQSRVAAVTSNGRIYNNGDPANGGTCWCVQTFDVNRSRTDTVAGQSGFRLPGQIGSASGSSTGIGDTLIRVKGGLLQNRWAALSVGADLRLPSGDAEDYHGAGATGFRPFAAVSLYTATVGGISFSPHFNFGGQVNGKSILAGDVFTGRKERLPSQIFYSGGATVGIRRDLTFVADILSTRLIDANRVLPQSAAGRGIADTATGVTLAAARQSYSMTNGAFGVKVKTIGNLVLTANTLVALDDTGLRDRLVPLFGISYSF